MLDLLIALHSSQDIVSDGYGDNRLQNSVVTVILGLRFMSQIIKALTSRNFNLWPLFLPRGVRLTSMLGMLV
jgi:hypothetical protein